MTLTPIENLEESLRALGKRANFSFNRKQTVRDRVFRMIGQVELADAIIEGKQKASILVSLKALKRALLPDKVSFSMPVTVAMMMLVFVSSIVTGALAQGANPADALFPVKKVLERIELAFISNPVNKAKVTLNIADDRIRHLGYSVNNEATLVKVLQESQLALVNAKSALQKISAQPAGDSESELVNKLTTLLNSQKEILNSIDKKAATTIEIKQAVVAIREALGENTAQNTSDTALTDAVKPSSKATLSGTPVNEVNIPLSGFVTLNGTMGSYTARPVILVQNKRYFLVGSQVDLIPYMGISGATAFGYVNSDTVTLTKLVIGGKLILEQETTSPSPESIINQTSSSNPIEP